MKFRRKSPDERLKLALVKHIERAHKGHWSDGIPTMAVKSITSYHPAEGGVNVVVELARAPRPRAMSFRHGEELAGRDRGDR